MNAPSQAPAPRTPSSLYLLWRNLTGGREGCPRKRFFLTLLLAAALLDVSSHFQLASQISAMMELQDSALDLLPPLVALLSIIPLILGQLASGIFQRNLSFLTTQLGCWQDLPMGEFLPESGGYVAGSGMPPVVFFSSALVVIVVGCIAFELGRRRLRDAGRSPWHLLAGLWYLLMDLLGWMGLFQGWDASLCLSLFSHLLGNLGGFWLLYLYCQPTRRTPPAP